MLKIDSTEMLENVVRVYVKGNLKVETFCGAVIEALKFGVDAKSVLIAGGVVPSSLPRYASLVSADFFASAR